MRITKVGVVVIVEHGIAAVVSEGVSVVGGVGDVLDLSIRMVERVCGDDTDGVA